jgi:hypothetical protein
MSNENWNPLLVSSDGITVTWREKYGAELSEDCIGIWETNNQYILTWKDEKKVYIEKCNVNGIRFTKK